MGNFNDVLMEQLADNGDGFYAYVDHMREAERIFVDELTGTLLTVAKDAKVQVEFNPEVVERWRLVGFENRDVADEDFRNDDIDAGEIGAGHSVTAIYEIRLVSTKPTRTLDSPPCTCGGQDPDSGEVTEINREMMVAGSGGRLLRPVAPLPAGHDRRNVCRGAAGLLLGEDTRPRHRRRRGKPTGDA